jgi:hypothetical protein
MVNIAINEEIRKRVKSGKTFHQVAAEMNTTVSYVLQAISAAPPIEESIVAGMDRDDLAE